MTIREAQKKYTYLSSLDIEILIAHTINKPKEFIFTYPESKLSLWQQIRLRYYIYLRQKGYSIAAIIGHKEFYGLDFYVNKNVLIPRPETELIVEEALGILNNELKNKNSNITVIDVGTGTGCIPISILKSLAIPIQTFAIDISKPALQVAKKNATKHGANINFLHGNLLQPFLKKYRLQTNKLIITANLPYGWSAWKNNSSVDSKTIKKEPAIALFTGENGLELYRKLLEQIQLIRQPTIALFEFDPRQTKLLTELILSKLPTAKIEIKKDLADRDRLAIITL